MTVATLAWGVGMSTAPRADRALSSDAIKLRSALASAVDFGASISLGQPRWDIIRALDDGWARATHENWDGLGSAPVERSTYEYAREFLGLLSPGALPPDVSIDSDGEFSFEWDRGPRRVFSVSVGRDGTLTYAGLFGHTKSHGVEQLVDAIPAVIALNIERVQRGD